MATTLEGAIELDVPMRADGTRGPGTVGDGPFYNPAMRFNRDLSVLFVEQRLHQTQHEQPFLLYDGLAASGARGLRLAKECQPRPNQEFRVVMNDRDPEAIERIRRHTIANNVADRVEIRQSDFSQGFQEDRFDHVDIDPFGSPMPFVDAALRHVRNGGIVAATATDVAALCGVHPPACRRRYDAVPWHGPGMHEVGLRILAGAIVRHAARFDKEARLILCHATDHYMRIYMEVRRGAKRADEAVSGLGWAIEDADGTRRIIGRDEPIPGGATRKAGPLWAGPLHDAELVAALNDRLGGHPQLADKPVQQFLERAAEEADASPLIYEVGELASRVGVSPPKFAAVAGALRAGGHSFARSHFSPTAIRTDAPRHILDKILQTDAMDTAV